MIPDHVSVLEARVYDVGPGVLLQLLDTQGVIGQGEATPRANYSPDTQQACSNYLRGYQWRQLPRINLEQPLAVQIRDIVADLDATLPACRFAVETALLDLAGQHLNRPLPDLIAESGSGNCVALGALLPATGDVLKTAREALAHGITTLKLKVGDAPDRIEQLLAVLRAEFGDTVAIRLDANQRLRPREARAYLHAWAHFDPEFIEEPVPFESLAALGTSPIPVALDESLQSDYVAAQLDTLLDQGRVQAVVLKPMALGGALRCLDLSHRAREAGATVVVTHLFDGPVALAATAGLALAIEGVAACGLTPHSGLDAWPTLDLPGFERASIRAWSLPGLGLDTLRFP